MFVLHFFVISSFIYSPIIQPHHVIDPRQARFTKSGVVKVNKSGIALWGNIKSISHSRKRKCKQVDRSVVQFLSWIVYLEVHYPPYPTVASPTLIWENPNQNVLKSIFLSNVQRKPKESCRACCWATTLVYPKHLWSMQLWYNQRSIHSQDEWCSL